MEKSRRRRWPEVLSWMNAPRARRSTKISSRPTTRLSVETLEARSLLSASTAPPAGMGDDFACSIQPAPDFFVGAGVDGQSAPATWEHGDLARIDGQYVMLAPPHSLEHFVLAGTAGTYVYAIRASAPLAGHAPDEPGPVLARNNLNAPIGAGSSASEGPIAAKAPAGGSGGDDFANGALLGGFANTATIGQRPIRTPSPLLPPSMPDSSADGGDAVESTSPLLRALESRDAVFQALAARGAALRSSDLADSLFTPARDGVLAEGDAAAESDDYVKLTDDGDLEGFSLRESTDLQIGAVRRILDQLELETSPTETQPQAARSDVADAAAIVLPPPDEPPTAATQSDAEGGMILLRTGAAVNGQLIVAGGTDAVDASGEPSTTVAMEAAVGFYQAFAVASDDAQLNLPAAAVARPEPSREAPPREVTTATDASASDRRPAVGQMIAVGAGIVALTSRTLKSRDRSTAAP